ncbi:MAG: Mur ligase family protein [Casimicrobiaceae bacterium]
MRYGFDDIVAMLRTPAGRLQLRAGLFYRAWPLLSRLGWLHRRTLARGVRVVAVVGSLGKSTTTRAVAAALNLPPHPAMLRNAWSSVARAILRLEPHQAHAVIEIGINARGQMRQYARVVRPDITVVTAVASEHHRSLGTLDVTRDEKAWMVRGLPADGVAVLNGDDPNVLWMRTTTTARVITFGFDERCDVRADDVQLEWPVGTRFTLDAFGERRSMTLRLLGRHQVPAALAAIAVAELVGVPRDQAIGRLEGLAPTTGRLQPVDIGNGVILLRDEWKSTLETFGAALDVLAAIDASRRIIVLGDISEPPGNQHQAYRALGRRIAAVASLVVIAGAAGALERYRAGLRAGGLSSATILAGGRTPQEIAATLRGLLAPGDVVLVKGRDTQRLDRVRLILQGIHVGCDIRACHIRGIECADCPMLPHAWGERPPVT